MSTDAISGVTDYSSYDYARRYSDNMEDYFIYSRDGEVRGVDYARYYSDNRSELEEFKDLNLSMAASDVDTFAKTIDLATKKHEESKGVKNNVKSSVNLINNSIATVSISNSSSDSADGRALMEEYYTMRRQAVDLTKSDSSVVQVLEQGREFTYKANNLVDKINDYNKTSEEEEESAVSIDTVQDKYDAQHEIGVSEADLLNSNPFYKNAKDTFDIEEEDKVDT